MSNSFGLPAWVLATQAPSPICAILLASHQYAREGSAVSDAPKPEGRLRSVVTNVQTDEGIEIPVERGPGFVRLAATSFSAWHVPARHGSETKFNVYFQAIENRETNHYLATDAQGVPSIDKKTTKLIVNDLASMELTIEQMRALKTVIDGALRVYEEDSRAIKE